MEGLGLSSRDRTRCSTCLLYTSGIIPCTDGTWLHFDMVPEEYEIRRGDADYTGRLCVIGSHLDEEELAKLFGLA